MSLVPDGGLPRPIRRASMLLGACAALAAVDIWDAQAALRHVNAGFDALRMVADPDTVAQVLGALRSSLHYDTVIDVSLVVLLVPFSRILRRPSRHVRAATWGLVVAAWFALGCGLASFPDGVATPTGTEALPIRQAWSKVLPVWYPAVHSLTVFAVLVAVTTVAILLARSGLQDFYRPDEQTDGPTGLWSYARTEDRSDSAHGVGHTRPPTPTDSAWSPNPSREPDRSGEPDRSEDAPRP